MIVTVPASRCPKCGSTERSRYTKTLSQSINGTDRDGQPFSAITRRWCSCLSCGQARVDRTYENKPR